MPDQEERQTIVYMSGNNGSGKTTLGRALAGLTGFVHLPEEKFERSYLTDLFAQQRRWSFEAQVHFLTFKIAQVQRVVRDGAKAFIDRSPYEDAEVFARYFYLEGRMDRRSYRTYVDLYRALIRGVPEPDLILFCDCPLETIAKRVAGRDREYEKLYPKGHLSVLSRLYDAWLTRIVRTLPDRVFRLQSDRIDVDDKDKLQQLAAEVKLLASRPHDDGQFGLFPQASDPQIELFVQPSAPSLLQPAQPGRLPGAPRSRRRPVAYIAAPFTGRATDDATVAEQENLPDGLQGTFEYAESVRHHGSITDLAYRQFLESIEAVAREVGYDTLLPHRDINRWGERQLTPEEASAECTKAVFASDVVVAIPESSLGAHYEIGIAIGYGLPVVLLLPSDGAASLLMRGLHTQQSVWEIRYSSERDLGQRLRLRLSSLAEVASD